MIFPRNAITSIAILFCLLCIQSIHANEVTNIHLKSPSDELIVTWNALGSTWKAGVTRDSYLGDYIPLIEVSVKTGNEYFISLLPNCFYRGTLLDNMGNMLPDSVVYLNICDNSVPFTGFVAKDNNMYKIEKDSSSGTGIRMYLEQTADDVYGADDVVNGNEGWGAGGSGGVLTPASLYPRGNTPENFPSIDIYVNPSFRSQVGEDNYVYRIIEAFSGANVIYQQSAMKQLHLSAIILLDEDISITDSQGSIIHGLEKIRKYTGGEFNMPGLWGWAEGGYSCYLQVAVAEGYNINTHNVAKSASAVIDLPTLLQRVWILSHEIGHNLGMAHTDDDPLADNEFDPTLALKDYVAGCEVKSDMFKSCAYEPPTNFLTDFYTCN